MSIATTETQTPAGAVGASAGFGGLQARSSAALSQEARLAIRNLDFFYGDNRALKGINLDLPARQVTGRIGASG